MGEHGPKHGPKRGTERRRYRAPRLVDYGSISGLTLETFSTGSIFDLKLKTPDKMVE